MRIAKNMEFIFLFATVIGLNLAALSPTNHTDIQVSSPTVVAVASVTAQV
jgi:hypothetical protein